MDPRRLVPLCVPVLAGLLAACRPDATGAGADPGAREALRSLSAAERAMVRGDNAFGFDLLSRLAAEGGGNILVSPLGVSLAVTMAYNGARGETAAGMARALGHGDLERDRVNALYRRLVPALLAADPKVTLSLANSIWSRPDLAPEREFLDLNREVFGAQASVLDFQSPDAVPALNRWVSTHTRGLIPEIARAPLPGNLVMMLLNALYFKGDWSAPFDPENTYDAPFLLADGTAQTCRMMRGQGSFTTFEDGNARGLLLPYGDSLFAMALVQPKEASGMAGLIEALRAGGLEAWLEQSATGQGWIHVPKFASVYGNSLAETLKAMGMGLAFSDSADFTGIRRTGDLWISDVIHKVLVQVDEKGTEAAAVTRVDIVTRSAPPDLIRFDRPFVFAIREKTTGALLFVGRIMDPTL